MTVTALLMAAMVAIAVTSWVLVAAIRRHALRHAILDHPGRRSSHAAPTPRGGGAGVILAIALGFAAIAGPGRQDWRVLLGFSAATVVAVAGWLDDRNSLPVLPRFGAQLLAGLLVVPIAVSADASTVTTFAAVVWIGVTVSAINVINFMDGIDGLIGLQSAIFGLHVAVLSDGGAGGLLGVTITAAAFGFLLWNWSPAKIFLGDVGSGGLAVLCLVAGVLVWQDANVPFIAVFLPLGPLFLDATVTILVRIRRRERLTVAHRKHLYQWLANEAGWGHARVSAGYALAAALGSLLGIVAGGDLRVVIAYIALVFASGIVLRRRTARPAR